MEPMIKRRLLTEDFVTEARMNLGPTAIPRTMLHESLGWAPKQVDLLQLGKRLDPDLLSDYIPQKLKVRSPENVSYVDVSVKPDLFDTFTAELKKLSDMSDDVTAYAGISQGVNFVAVKAARGAYVFFSSKDQDAATDIFLAHHGY